MNQARGASPTPLKEIAMAEEKKVQQRTKYAKKGESEMKMISFRADAETVKYLEKAGNKGRLINKLVQRWGRRHPWEDPDQDPDTWGLEEYRT